MRNRISRAALVVAALALASMQAAAQADDWANIVTNASGTASYDLKVSSIKQGRNNQGEAYIMAIGRTTWTTRSQIDLIQLGVYVRDCRLGYGEMRWRNVGKDALPSVGWVRSSGTVASALAEALCSVAAPEGGT